MSIANNIKIGAKNVSKFVAHESPTILTGLGITGVVTTVILAIKATPKAMQLLDKEWEIRLDKSEVAGTETKDFTTFDMVKTTWKCYLPTILVGSASIACFVGANSINLRRNAALASIYTLTEATLREYQEKVVEVIGTNKEEKVRDQIASDKLAKDPLENKEIIMTGKGETLFYETLSGRYFKSDIETIRKAINEFNHSLLLNMEVTLNAFYDLIGLADTDLGRENGWDVEDGMLEIRFSARIVPEQGIPCIVLDYSHLPGPLEE